MNVRRCVSIVCVGNIWICAGATAPPSTAPTRPATDPSMDSILGFSRDPANTGPHPTTAPSPFTEQNGENQSRPGEIELSDGKKIRGSISTTQEKPVRIWVEKEKNYEDIPLDQVSSAIAIVMWERDEKEWNFKESGSDVKVYSGKTYPARQTQYKFTLTDGTVIQGDVVVPLMITTLDGKTTTYVLYKRDKGKVGETLTDLTYVKSVAFR